MPEEEVNQLLEIISQYPNVNNRITLSRNKGNKEYVGTLEATDQIIRKYCKEGDIILQVNTFSIFIGTHVFNLINWLYKKDTKLWFVYANYLQYNTEYGISLIEKTKAGLSRQIK